MGKIMGLRAGAASISLMNNAVSQMSNFNTTNYESHGTKSDNVVIILGVIIGFLILLSICVIGTCIDRAERKRMGNHKVVVAQSIPAPASQGKSSLALLPPNQDEESEYGNTVVPFTIKKESLYNIEVAPVVPASESHSPPNQLYQRNISPNTVYTSRYGHESFTLQDGVMPSSGSNSPVTPVARSNSTTPPPVSSGGANGQVEIPNVKMTSSNYYRIQS